MLSLASIIETRPTNYPTSPVFDTAIYMHYGMYYTTANLNLFAAPSRYIRLATVNFVIMPVDAI